MTWHQPVNQGANSWNVISGSQPASDLASNACNAVPGVNLAPQDLSSAAGSALYEWTILRPVPLWSHVAVGVNVKIQLKWDYGVRYKGAGAFIPGCWVEVPTCETGYGYDVSVYVVVDAVENAGTSTAPNARLKIR